LHYWILSGWGSEADWSGTDPSIAISGAYNDVGATIFPNAKNIVLKQLSSSTFH